MRFDNYSYYHGTYADLELSLLDPKRFHPARYGGKGLFVTNNYDMAREKGHKVYRINGYGNILDFNKQEDNLLFLRFLNKNPLLEPSRNPEGKAYDIFSEKNSIDIMVMNQNVAVIKNISSIKSLDLID